MHYAHLLCTNYMHLREITARKAGISALIASGHSKSVDNVRPPAATEREAAAPFQPPREAIMTPCRQQQSEVNLSSIYRASP